MKEYIKEKTSEITVFIICLLIFVIIFFLYKLPIKATVYPILLCTGVIIIYFIRGYIKFNEKHRHLQILKDINISQEISKYTTTIDKDYMRIIENLERNLQKEIQEKQNTISDMIDYYTTWVHQIKTPIASMYLTIQSMDTEESRILKENLFSIEQYVDMALCYIRLDSNSTDYLFKKQELDPIIKESIRKFATQFINKKIGINYTPINATIVTDEKWISFVIEQIISNSLKYTKTGSITIEYNENKLKISDTGIGIAKEDLPRIFEKGYTGFNGREYRKSSGLGLYLCKKICDRLGHKISADSVIDKGTTITIEFTQKITTHE